MNTNDIDTDLMSAFLNGELSSSQAKVIAQAIDEDPAVREMARQAFRPDIDLRNKLLDTFAIEDFATEPELLSTLEVLRSLSGTIVTSSKKTTSVTTTPALPEPVEGKCQIGDYEVLEVLNSGGMGTVYRVLHSYLRLEFALKVIVQHRRDSSQAHARFLREVALNGRLQHPNLVRTVYAGEHHGTPYLVMELIEGKDIERIAKEAGPLLVADACEIIRQASVGIGYLGTMQLVHRDVKPSNMILAAPQGNDKTAANFSATVKILDLGLSISTGGETTCAAVTLTDQVLGTIDYLAPEQAIDSRNVDTRADIYALGCTLYRLLAGVPPFAQPGMESVVARLFAHHQLRPRPLSKLRPDVPASLCKIIEKAMAKKPSRRFANGDELAQALSRYSQGADLKKLLSDPEENLEQFHVQSAHPEKVHTSSKRFRRILSGVIGFMFLSAFLIVTISNDQGTLIVTSAAETQIEIRYDNGSTKQLKLEHGETPIKTSSGKVLITLTDSTAEDLVIQNPHIVIRQGETATVTIEQRPKPVQESDVTKSISSAKPKSVQVEWQAKAAAEVQLPLQFTNELGMQFQMIPATRHCPGITDSEPAVTSSFYMKSHEVSVAEYEQVMRDLPAAFPNRNDQQKLPVRGVSWSEAIEFCRRLSDLPEERKHGHLYSLPTLVEWEWACRAGNSLQIPWTQASVRQHVVFHESDPHPVGSYPPNPFGLFDMHGNVAEWVADWIPEPTNDQQPNSPFIVKVACGGSYESSRLEEITSSAKTLHHADDETRLDQGFRIICRIPKQPPSVQNIPNDPEQDFDQMLLPDHPQRGWGFPGGAVTNRNNELIQAVGGGSEWGSIWYGGHGNLNDFDLRFDFKIQGREAETQLLFRANVLEQGWTEGSLYRLYLAGSKAGLLFQATPQRSGVVDAMPADILVGTRLDTWNELIVRCEGRRTQIWLNSQLAIDFTDPVAGVCLRGPVSFLTTGSPEGPRSTARFRNLRIRLLGNPPEEDRKHMPWSMGMDVSPAVNRP